MTERLFVYTFSHKWAAAVFAVLFAFVPDGPCDNRPGA